jgi:hypothetical protein
LRSNRRSATARINQMAVTLTIDLEVPMVITGRADCFTVPKIK